MMRHGFEFDDNQTAIAVAIAASANAIHSIQEARTRSTTFNNGIAIPRPGSSLKKQSRNDPTPLVTEVLRKRTETSRELGTFSTRADAWESSQIAKIRKRYDKIHAEVSSWEHEKKQKEKNRMERKMDEMELRKTRIMRHYQGKVAKIDRIAETARAQIEEKRRQKEAIVKDKARTFRATRNSHLNYCFCF